MATTSKTADPADDLRKELDALRKDFSSLVDTVKDLGKDRADKAMGAARERMGKANERVHASAHDARERGEALAGELETIVLSHPTRSVLIALGLGYLFGRMRG